MVMPMRLGRSLERCAKIPIFGQSVRPRGCRAPFSTLSAGILFNRKITSTSENRSNP